MSQNVPGSDDQRVLEELERLRRAIRATRERPETALAAPADEPPAPAHGAVGRAPTIPAPITAPARTREATPPSAAPAPPVAVAAAPSPAVIEPDIPSERPGARARPRVLIAALAVAVALLLGWFLLRDPAPAPAAETAAAPREAVAAPPVAEPTAPPVDPHPLRIDIVTSRPVWMRVTVDGRIAIERELPQGERLPFGADKSIVVRAGDAGAVSVLIGNVDQGPLGRDGQVVTRLFEAPAR